jgi:ferredoxin
MSLIPRISVKVLGPLFGTRYRLASLTRRSKTFNRIITRMFFEGDDMIVLPKDDVVKTRRIETDIRIEDAGETTVLPSDVVKGIIERSSDIFIMNFCLCRKSNKCEDYPREKGCVFLGKGVHKIPEDFGHLATAEEAKAYIDECTELGLVHIIGRNKLDSIWLDTGDKKDLMTICNCCPCCCLWNMACNISDDIGSSFKRMDGVTVTVDADECIGCGLCPNLCPQVFHMLDEGVAGARDEILPEWEAQVREAAESCPVNAIEVD